MKFKSDAASPFRSAGAAPPVHEMTEPSRLHPIGVRRPAPSVVMPPRALGLDVAFARVALAIELEVDRLAHRPG